MRAAVKDAIWHDVECGSYAADLELWEELAGEADGPILDLGCGTGRVALHLTRRGHRVIGLDSNSMLLDVLSERGADLSVETVTGDARDFRLEEDFALVLAPMQLVQLFDTAAERRSCLIGVAAHLRPGGKAAFAIALAADVLGDESVDPRAIVPDVREIDGWVYSSFTREILLDSERISIRRHRETVSPQGQLSTEPDEVTLRILSPDALEREATEAGLTPCPRRSVPPTDEHVGSAVIILEAP